MRRLPVVAQSGITADEKGVVIVTALPRSAGFGRKPCPGSRRRLLPAEARTLAELLLRAADLAEGK